MDPEYASGHLDGHTPVRNGDMPTWWLRITSAGWEYAAQTVEERDLARRSRLASWVILGLLVTDVVLVPGGIAVKTTLAAVIAGFIGLLIAALLNRQGHVSAAGTVIVLVISCAFIYVMAYLPGGLSLVYLPTFDLLVISTVVAASVLPRVWVFGVAALNIGLVVGDFVLQPHAPDVARAVHTYGAVSLVVRPIALQIIVAAVAYLWVRGTGDAIRRADRAEELADLEHTIADQKRQLDVGIQQILQTHVRAANGDFSARAPLGQENILWQIAASLNNLLSRLQRAGLAEHQLHRTEEELRRLAAAIDDAQAGRRPIWPAPTGTAADMILDRITHGTRPAAPPLSGSRAHDAYGSPPGLQPPSRTPPSGPMYPPREEPSRSGPTRSGPSQLPENPWALPAEDA